MVPNQVVVVALVQFRFHLKNPILASAAYLLSWSLFWGNAKIDQTNGASFCWKYLR